MTAPFGYALLVFVVSWMIMGVSIGKDGSILKFEFDPVTRFLSALLLALATLLVTWK